MLHEMAVAASDRLWAEALNYTCDMSNMCVASSLEGDTSPYEKWYGSKPSLEHLKQPFGPVGYARKGKRAHKLAPRENSVSCWAMRITTRVKRSRY